jgi:DNA-binding winged helix-turn-helix (wHTH) protein/TolB-like protein
VKDLAKRERFRPDGFPTVFRFFRYGHANALSKDRMQCLSDASMTADCDQHGAARYRVNDYVVIPATNEIALGESTTRIEPKSMEVLVFLFEHVGEVVSRARIQDEIWGDVVVGDDSLTNAIIKIRKAFGDDARDPQVIETIPKRGYRLIADVALAPTPADKRPSPRTRWLAPAGAMLAVMILAISLWMVAFESQDADRLPVRADTRPRIAVAPFSNLSGDPSQDYLAHGVRQTILTGLAGIRQVAAMPRLEDANRRPADYHLEGSVKRNTGRIRVDTQLIEANSGIVLATHRYDRPFSDLITIESEIEADVIGALELDIDLAVRTNRSRGYTRSIEAYDLFLQAQAALLPRDQAGNLKARALYHRAIKRDPRFARAYGGLALTHAADYRNGWTNDATDALNKAQGMATTALEIQPELPEQHWIIGYVHTQRRSLHTAETALKTAIRLDPEYADAFALLGGIRTYAGQPKETLPLLREAIRLRPGAGYLYFLLLGRAHYFLEDCEQAQINLNEALVRNPANEETRLYLAACMVRQGEIANAQWEALEILNNRPDFTLAGFFRTYPMVAPAQIETLARDLNRAGLP